MLNLKNKFHHLFIQNNNQFFVQFVRYFFTGGLAFLVDFGMLVFLTEICGFYYIFSNTISFTLGLLISYTITIFWVFTKSKFSNRKLEFAFFAVIGIIGLVLTNVLLWCCTHVFGIYYLLSKIIATGIVYIWNFLAKKYWLFK